MMEEVDLSYLENVKRTRAVIPDKNRCLGRKLDGLRCTRRRIHSKEFCRSHSKSLPNGRIDDGMIVEPKKIKQGRARKYNSDYICVYKRVINNKTYLLDNENYVYLNNLKFSVRIGKYDCLEDRIHYFTKN